MSFLERMSSLVAAIAPHVAVGKEPRHLLSRADLEREAEVELQARIDLGRPGSEEAVRTRPVPAWLMPRPVPTRPLDVVAVHLDALPLPPRSHPERPRRPQPSPRG